MDPLETATPAARVGLLEVGEAWSPMVAAALAALGPPLVLGGLAEVARSALDVLVLGVSAEGGLETFAALREAHPQLPVVLVADGLDANLAVELVKCGAADAVVLPVDPEVLARKVERALRLVTGPVAVSSLMEPLFRAQEVPWDGRNRRACFRALVPPRLAAPVDLVEEGERHGTQLLDISLATGEHAGGMLLFVPAAAAARLRPRTWGRHRDLSLVLHLPDGEPPLALRARLARVLHEADRTARLGVMYVPRAGQEAARIQRYWVLCQRHAERR